MLFNSPIKTLFASLAIAALFVLLMLQGAAYPGPGPTPIPAADSDGDVHRELSEWWDWCLRHPNVIVREDKRWAVYNVEGGWELPFITKLKVVGALAGRPPFASMWKFQTYEEFRHPTTEELLGLRGQGFSYQTDSSTGIGQGEFKRVVWPDPEAVE